MEPYAKAHQHRQHSFLLYTEPVYRLRNPEGYFGYADKETADQASSHIGELVKMGGTSNGIAFDPGTEVKHFSRRPCKIIPPVYYGDMDDQGPRLSLPPSPVRGAIRAFVEPVLLYSAEAWYPSLTQQQWTTRGYKVGQTTGRCPEDEQAGQPLDASNPAAVEDHADKCYALTIMADKPKSGFCPTAWETYGSDQPQSRRISSKTVVSHTSTSIR
ncbi:hypothetical protein BJX68DRAFT_266862 [Aspergillus pseudodeflectus]|uniref:Uncharacterized protein n=1 Tax=Aspergillus pseudodeflectus TaxID=176178 RepID=A0ABR4KCQ1_9EURO